MHQTRESNSASGANPAPQGKRIAPVQLQRWGMMAANLALCGACVWLMIMGLFLATEKRWFFAALVIASAVQAVLEFWLFSAVRRLRSWPDTPRLAFCRFALGLGLLPLLAGGLFFVLNRLSSI